MARLQDFEQDAEVATASPGELFQDNLGATLFDAPGDLGVRRPNNDEDWDAALGAMGTTMAAEPTNLPKRRARPEPVPEDESPGSRLGGIAGRFGRRRTAVYDPADAPRERRSAAAAPRPRRTDDDAAAPARRSSFLPLALAAMTILVVGVVGYLLLQNGFLAKAPTLQLLPPPNEIAAETYPNLVVPISSVPLTDTTTTAVYGRILDTPVTVSVAGVAEASAKTPIARATGTLTLRNTTSQPIEIPAGTALQANGLTFTFDQAVVVPNAVYSDEGTTFGRADASVTAETPGAEGNLAAGVISAIPGYEGALRVAQGAFAGGTDQEVRIVRVDDVNKVLPAAMSQLYTTGVQALQLKTAEVPGWSLPAATITPTLAVLKRLQGFDYSVSPPIGSVAGDEGGFTVELRSHFQAVAEPNTAQARMEQQLSQALKQQLINIKQINPQSIVSVDRWVVRGQTLVATAKVQAPDSAPALAPEFLQEVQRSIAGQPRAAAEAYLQSQLEQHTIGALPTLPAEWTTIPTNLKLVQASAQQ